MGENLWELQSEIRIHERMIDFGKGLEKDGIFLKTFSLVYG
ncbi:hypothetical protein [Leptospira stimsonii]|nr:hypothetical protein [Leptospira stimsonii]